MDKRLAFRGLSLESGLSAITGQCHLRKTWHFRPPAGTRKRSVDATIVQEPRASALRAINTVERPHGFAGIEDHR